MFYTRSGSLYIACVSSNMAQNKQKYLSFSSNAEKDKTSQVFSIQYFNFCAAFLDLHFIVDFFADRAKCPCLTAASCNIATVYLNFTLQCQHFDVFLSYQWNVLLSGMFFLWLQGLTSVSKLNLLIDTDMLTTLHTLKYTSHIVIWCR